MSARSLRQKTFLIELVTRTNRVLGIFMSETDEGSVSARVEHREIAVGSLLEAALEYAKRGLHVFPCNPIDKRPLVGCDRDEGGHKIEKTGGLYKGTTDENQIRTWWAEWPNAMIGVRTGEVSGFWAIDPDAPEHPDDQDGRKNWIELQQTYSAASATHSHITPSGGQHLLFRYRAGKPVGNSEGQIAGLGINVRGNGGYVIFPPSFTAKGTSYKFADPDKCFQFADAPDWLYDLLLPEKAPPPPEIKVERHPASRKRYGEAALRDEVSKLAQMLPESGRNIALNRAAFCLGQLVAAGALRYGHVCSELFRASTENGSVRDTGARQVRATIFSGITAGTKIPRIFVERAYDSDGPEPKARDTKGWPFKSARDFRSDFTRNWIVKGVIAPGEVSTWCGPPGCGKSALLGDLSLHVTAGRDWRSYKSKQKGAVVYFALERADLVERRFNAQCAQYGIDPKTLPFHVVGMTIDMVNQACVNKFIATIRSVEAACDLPVIMIVIDTSAKAIAAGGGEENSAKDKNIVRANGRRVMEEIGGLHVAFVSHTGKDPDKRERGSNASEGDDDLLVMLNGQLAKIEKRNDGPDGVLTGYGVIPITVGKDDDGDEITIGIIDPDATQRGAPPSKKKLPDQVATALKYLAETINESGKPPPGHLGLPSRISRAVTIEEWRNQCERRHLSGGKTSDSFRKAFERAVDKLQQEGLIAVLDDHVWMLYE